MSGHPKFTYILESLGAALVADSQKVVLVRSDGSVELIASLDGEAYQWEGIGAGFYNEIIQKRMDGFKMLPKIEHDRFVESQIYKSARDIPVAHYAHDGALLFFSGKSIGLLNWEEERLVELKTTKSKGRDPIARALHPEQNLLVYGTNHGELYSLAFTKDSFLKSTKVDQLPNTCYQITFSPDGHRMFLAGLGFVKSYDFNGTGFTPNRSITTAVRSFQLVEDYLVLNKGMHGLDVIRVKNEVERITSMDLPFSIDQMHYLAPQKTFLLTSGSTNEWALLNWTA